MIRYEVTLTELESAVEKEKPGWLEKAKKCTTKCKAQRKYVDHGSIWGEIKSVYMKLQFNKCIYCERKLASKERVNADGTLEMIGPGSIEHDVEHFRPKSGIKQWPTEKIKKDRNINYNFTLGNSADRGYYLLAFHPFNYATSCKTCNTPLKGNFFPVAGKRKSTGSNPLDLSNENAFLIYPLGKIDDDPTSIISFEGYLVKPAVKSGPRYKRAVVTIDFFELDTREELIRERADAIVAMYMAYVNRKSTDATIADIAARNLASRTTASAPHTNCCQAYLKLLENKLGFAKELAVRAQQYLDSESE